MNNEPTEVRCGRAGVEPFPTVTQQMCNNIVGAVCDRPRANTVRPYGFYPRLGRIGKDRCPRLFNFTGGYYPPLQTLSHLCYRAQVRENGAKRHSRKGALKLAVCTHCERPVFHVEH